MSEQVVAQSPAPAPAKRRRGRESAGDMVRSLSLILLVVGVLYYFAQAAPGDKKSVRVVDPSGDVQSFSRAAPTAVVPGPLPPGWRSTVTERLGVPDRLRVGWNTPTGQYAEYDAVSGPAGTFVDDVTGRAVAGEPVTVAGRTFRRYRNDAGVQSLVLAQGGSTVVVGSLRSSATEQELVALAGSLGRR